MPVSIEMSLIGLSRAFYHRGILLNESNSYVAGPRQNKSGGLKPGSRSLVRIVERGKSFRAIRFNFEDGYLVSINIDLHFVSFGKTFYILIAISG